MLFDELEQEILYLAGNHHRIRFVPDEGVAERQMVTSAR